jgi:hypothetical protein
MMALSTSKLGLLAVLAVSCSLGVASVALAQTLTPSAQNEREGDTTGLGQSHRFATAAAAADHCPGDTIVWSASPDLIYVLPGASTYGVGTGFYACKAEADDDGFSPANP